jgi:biotin transport system substrate-specific component
METTSIFGAALGGRTSAVKQTLVVLGGSALVALAAQISVPFFPVPMTLQTLAVLLVGLTCGARLGALALIAYLIEGAAGLPVFAQFRNGIAFAGPTAGFLVGFVMMAFLAGLVVDLGVRLPLAVATVAISALLYVPGVAWAMLADAALGVDASKWGADNFAMIWQYYMAPFLIGDTVKAVIAALLVTGAWAALSRRAA